MPIIEFDNATFTYDGAFERAVALVDGRSRNDERACDDDVHEAADPVAGDDGMRNGAHDADERAGSGAEGEADDSGGYERNVELEERCRREQRELDEAQKDRDRAHERHRDQLLGRPPVRVLQVLLGVLILRRDRHRLASCLFHPDFNRWSRTCTGVNLAEEASAPMQLRTGSRTFAVRLPPVRNSTSP